MEKKNLIKELKKSDLEEKAEKSELGKKIVMGLIIAGVSAISLLQGCTDAYCRKDYYRYSYPRHYSYPHYRSFSNNWDDFEYYGNW